MATQYPDVLSVVLNAIDGFRERKVSLRELQSVVDCAANTISLPEERSLSDMLRRLEGQIELIQYTVEPANVMAEADDLLQPVVDRIKEVLLP